MKFPVLINGKIYKLKYFEYLAYKNQERIEKLEKELARHLNECGNQRPDKSTKDSESGTDKPV